MSIINALCDRERAVVRNGCLHDRSIQNAFEPVCKTNSPSRRCQQSSAAPLGAGIDCLSSSTRLEPPRRDAGSRWGDQISLMSRWRHGAHDATMPASCHGIGFATRSPRFAPKRCSVPARMGHPFACYVASDSQFCERWSSNARSATEGSSHDSQIFAQTAGNDASLVERNVCAFARDVGNRDRSRFNDSS